MGEFVDSWQSPANGTVWAKMSTNRTDEAIQAMATTGTAIHNINILYRTDVRSNWRIKYGTRLFAIIGPPIDVGFKHRELDIKCKETA
jgi:SPP1 family predicted phage head-tail adaptor